MSVRWWVVSLLIVSISAGSLGYIAHGAMTPVPVFHVSATDEEGKPVMEVEVPLDAVLHSRGEASALDQAVLTAHLNKAGSVFWVYSCKSPLRAWHEKWAHQEHFNTMMCGIELLQDRSTGVYLVKGVGHQGVVLDGVHEIHEAVMAAVRWSFLRMAHGG